MEKMRTMTRIAVALAAVAIAACQSSARDRAPEDRVTTQYATVNGLRLAYESHGPTDGETILLIGGTGMQLIDWPSELVDTLVDRGYRVVTFDNRDVGLSTRLDSLGAPDWPAIIRAGQEGRPAPLPYTLEDMAADAVGLLTALGVEKAHIVGASQGGIITQLIAIHYPDRVLSITPMMSGSGDPSQPMPAKPDRLKDIGDPPTDTAFATQVEYQMRVDRALAGAYPPDDTTLRARVVRRLRRGYDAEGLQRHQAAALVASYQDRREALRQVRVPAVVVQGADDPLVPPESARQVAESIPGAQFVLIPGMGHDMPAEVVGRVADAITSAARRARGASSQAPPATRP
jgi:pimeloyl-ACP methyl ester carboxylesterase